MAATPFFLYMVTQNINSDLPWYAVFAFLLVFVGIYIHTQYDARKRHEKYKIYWSNKSRQNKDE